MLSPAGEHFQNSRTCASRVLFTLGLLGGVTASAVTSRRRGSTANRLAQFF